MILATVSVEHDGGDFQIFRFRRNHFTDFRRFLDVLTLGRRHGGDRLALRVVDQLRVHARERTEDGETRANGGTDHLGANSSLACLPELNLGGLHKKLCCGSFRGGGLAGLSANGFVGVTDSFAFVRLRRTERANVCGDLTHELFIDAFEG